MRYFVSFVAQGPHGPSFGSTDMNTREPIRDGRDIAAAAAVIEDDNGLSDVVVLNFQRFDEPRTA